MAYTPTVWKTGDVVSSEKLNKMENGIANAGGGASNLFEILVDYDVFSGWYEVDSNISFDDIVNAYRQGKLIYLVIDLDPDHNGVYPLADLNVESGQVRFVQVGQNGINVFCLDKNINTITFRLQTKKWST